MRRTAEKSFVRLLYLFKASIAVIPLGNAKHPVPTRSLRLLRAAVRSAISAINYGCIMPIPLLKPVLCTEVIVSKIWITVQDIDCALTCDMLQTSEQLSRLSF